MCGKVSYCSRECLEGDYRHQNECEELIRRQLDPQYLTFEVEKGALAGLVGLKNMGNTCYMNSALQCLSHTTPFVQYFLRDQIFKNELNPTNPMASKNNEVTILFSKFLHQMWNKAECGTYSWEKNVFSPESLKKSIGKANELFKGT